MARTKSIGLGVFWEAGTILFLEWSRPVLIRLLACDREAEDHLKSAFCVPFLALQKVNRRPRRTWRALDCAAIHPALRRQALPVNSSIAARPRAAFLPVVFSWKHRRESGPCVRSSYAPTQKPRGAKSFVSPGAVPGRRTGRRRCRDTRSGRPAR